MSVQFSSVTQSCPTLCHPMNLSTPGLPVHHQLPEFTLTHVHSVGDAIQPSHPLSSLLLLPSLFPSIRVFSNKSALCIRWPKYWSFSFRISPSKERLVPLVCKDQLMCNPMCVSSQVPALVPVTHFLSCWGPGMVLSPHRSCCDSVGSSFSCALSCPSLGAASP